jgi:hypothetical protein
MRYLVTEKITRVGEYMAGRNRLGGLAIANGLVILAETELGLHQRARQVVVGQALLRGDQPFVAANAAVYAWEERQASL